MDKPQFYTDAEGNTFELQPVKVDRDQLEKDLAEAEKEAAQIDINIDKLEQERDGLMERVGAINDVLTAQYEAQEAAQEKVGFRRDRLEAFNSPAALNQPAPDGAPSAADEDLDDDADDEFDADEDLDEGDEPETAAAEPEELDIPIRRRSRV